MATQLIDFSPSNIDMIFAVSQQNLNQGLAEYIDGLSTQVKWAYDVDEAGNVTAPKNPLKPDISFSGTLAPPYQPSTGAPVWIVDLSQAGAVNQVTFNLTFQDGATFVDNQSDHTFVQSAQDGGPLWVIPFQVDLKKTAIKDTSNLPDWLQKQLAVLNGNYGDVFDLSQVLLDLETLTMTADPEVTRPAGISLYEWTMVITGMKQDITDNHGEIYTTPPTAGYAVTQNGNTPSKPVPSYTPTDADFVIVPSAADYGGASALVFVLMIKGSLPPNPASSFTNVDLITDPKATPGIALISSSHLINFMQSDFQSSAVGQAISQYVQSITSDKEGVTWKLQQLESGTTASVQTPSTSNNEEFLSFAMPTQNNDCVNDSFLEGNYLATATTNSTAMARFGNHEAKIGFDAITVGGTLSMSVGYSYTNPSSRDPTVGTAWNSPRFDWDWTAYYTIETVNASSLQSGGGVQFLLDESKSTFPTTPKDMGGGEGSWFTIQPSEQEFVNDLLSPVIKALPSTFEASFTSLGSLGSFVFPGGGTFTFQNPAVNDVLALYTTIQYLNPN